MFETSRPQISSRGRRLFYELLPVSIAAHAIVIGALIISAVWNVSFPDQSPKLYMAFRLSETPPPPPPPPPPPAAKPQTAQVKPVVRPPDEIVAPSVVPDAIPIVENEVVPQIEAPGAVEGGVEGGIEGGEIGGVVGGVIGSVVAATPQPPPPPPSDGRIHIERDQPLRMKVLAQVYPIYPYAAANLGWEDQLVVRYVIGKDGRVKEVTIVDPPERQLFELPTLRAIRLWRFRPFKQNGQAMEVVHELTVNFRLMQKGG